MLLLTSYVEWRNEPCRIMLRRNVPCGHCVLTINKCKDFDSNRRGQLKHRVVICLNPGSLKCKSSGGSVGVVARLRPENRRVCCRLAS